MIVNNNFRNCGNCGLAQYESSIGFLPQYTYTCSYFENLIINPSTDGCTFGVEGEPQQIFPNIEINNSDGLYDNW